MPEYNSQRRGTARTSQLFSLLCMFCALYRVCCLCVNVYRTTATGVNPIADNNNNNNKPDVSEEPTNEPVDLTD
jgi:hypothetical protein